jgi:hypothetical protein
VNGRDFLRGVISGARDQLPEALGTARVETGGSIGKLWFGNRALHYECGVRSRIGTVELGLHFEADPLTNARLLGAFGSRRKVVERRLGALARLEEWDRGWARVWEPHEARALDAALQAALAKRLARYVVVLEPILRDELPAEVSWRLPASRGA